jgi:hypothetical protein
VAQVELRVTDSTGLVRIECNGKHYDYFQVPRSIQELVKMYARKNWRGKIFRALKPYARKDVFER